MTLRLPAFNDALTYRAAWDRLALESALQEGIAATTDYLVTPAAAGGMRVDVAAGTAFVKGDSGAPLAGLSHGLYLAVNDASIPNAQTLAASNATNPRVDTIALRVRDSRDLGYTADDLAIVVLTGVATAGATLDNRTGAPALPGDHMRLADVLVPAGSTAVVAGNVRDRRPWARGFQYRLVASGADIGVPPSGGVGLFASRGEVTAGNMVELTLSGQVYAAAATVVQFSPTIDAAIPAGAAIADSMYTQGVSEQGVSPIARLIPVAGGHLFGWYAFSGAAGGTIRASTTNNLVFTMRELVGGALNANT